MKIVFDVVNPGDLNAGLISYTDTVTVEIESGDPGGNDGDFAEYMRDILAEWFDGAKVTERKSRSIEQLARDIAYANSLGVRADVCGDAKQKIEAERLYQEAMEELERTQAKNNE